MKSSQECNYRFAELPLSVHYHGASCFGVRVLAQGVICSVRNALRLPCGCHLDGVSVSVLSDFFSDNVKGCPQLHLEMRG